MDSKAFFKFVNTRSRHFLLSHRFGRRQSLISLLNFCQLVQEFLNLYNTSHPSPKFQEKLQSHCVWFSTTECSEMLTWLTLPIISAGDPTAVLQTRLIPVLQHGCTRGLLVESWAHNPEDTGSDPRAGVYHFKIVLTSPPICKTVYTFPSSYNDSHTHLLSTNLVKSTELLHCMCILL